MSWDNYRDNLIASGSIDNAALCGLQDGGVWTQSSQFNISPAEVQNIIAGFKDNSILRSNGITLGGSKYFFIQSDDNQIQGKKGACGCSIAKSNMCIVIGTYKDGQQPGNARVAVEKIIEHLMTHNY